MTSFELLCTFVSELYGLCFVTVTSFSSKRRWIYNTADRGGAPWISSDGNDRMGVKIKTQKNPYGFQQNPQKSLDQNLTPPHLKKKKSHAKFPSLLDSNNTRNTKNMIFCFINNIMQDDNFRLFWIRKKSLPKLSHPKIYLPNFPTQKKSRNIKFQTQKHPSIILSGVPPSLWDDARETPFLISQNGVRIIINFWADIAREYGLSLLVTFLPNVPCGEKQGKTAVFAGKLW